MVARSIYLQYAPHWNLRHPQAHPKREHTARDKKNRKHPVKTSAAICNGTRRRWGNKFWPPQILISAALLTGKNGKTNERRTYTITILDTLQSIFGIHGSLFWVPGNSTWPSPKILGSRHRYHPCGSVQTWTASRAWQIHANPTSRCWQHIAKILCWRLSQFASPSKVFCCRDVAMSFGLCQLSWNHSRPKPTCKGSMFHCTVGKKWKVVLRTQLYVNFYYFSWLRECKIFTKSLSTRTPSFHSCFFEALKLPRGPRCVQNAELCSCKELIR